MPRETVFVSDEDGSVLPKELAVELPVYARVRVGDVDFVQSTMLVLPRTDSARVNLIARYFDDLGKLHAKLLKDLTKK